jgi:peptidyl-prolyl cis-trans isomerase SurA
MNTISTQAAQVMIPNLKVKAAVLLICISLGATSSAWSQAQTSAAKPKAQLADAIVAVVNSDVITRNELAARIKVVETQLQSQHDGAPPPAELRKQVLERMIVDRAQLQLAKERGMNVDDQMLDLAMTRIAEQNKLTLPQLRAQIEKEGTEYPRFREEIRDEITMQRLREREVESKVQILDSEIDNLIATQKSALQKQVEVNLAQILVRIPGNATADQISERRKRADDILRQLKNGGDFAKLAATYSDANDALKGGEIGWRGTDRVPQLFADAIANVPDGGVTDVVKSANGFHIIKVLGKRTPSVMNGGVAGPPAVEQTHVRHILVKVNQVVSTADARRKLVEIKSRLDNKTSTFEEQAKLYSNDSTSTKGGDLGWIYPGDTVPDFEKAMNDLKPGQISEPVESPFGFHLIQVLERKTEDVSKDRQRLAARQILRERKADDVVQDWLRQLRDRTYVEYRSEE